MASSEEKVYTDKDYIHLDPQKIYGYGRHGTVYAAKYYECDCVAKEMRHLKEEEAKTVSKAAFLKEMEIIKDLRHPNIVQLLDVCHKKDSSSSPILIMSKMSMTLNYFLKQSVNKAHYLYKKVDVLRDIACGLHYLHSKSIIHRDLTANAIFLTEDFSAKIADFGQAKHFIEDDKLTTLPGDLSYMPPEALVDSPIYTFKLDNFSYGCVVIQVITHEKPVPSYETRRQLPNGRFEPVSEIERRSEYIKKVLELKLYELHKIIEQCLQDNPDHRPNAFDLLSMIQKYKEILSPNQESKLPEQPKMNLIDENIRLKNNQKVSEQKFSNLLNEKCIVDSQKKQLEQELQEIKSASDSNLVAVGHPKWKYKVQNCQLELTGDLASVADPLLYSLRGCISDPEYHDISSTTNPVDKVSKLLEAIYARRDDQVFTKFCNTLRRIKFYVWAERLEKFL